jgi:tRNA threonylcarbamoyl adenosine modification protein YeaZ
MRVLAIDCATEACSLALFADGALIGHFNQMLGRGHAEHLVPAIAALPGKGRADRILVSLGPGSFTGVRIGLSAARALGLAWGAQVLGYPTLALVAAMAQRDHPGHGVTVCMAGGHGEWFVADFAADGSAQSPVASLAPEKAAQACQHAVIAGNRAADLAALTGRAATALTLLPDAADALLLSADLLTADLAPIYGRAPDARLPGGLAA